MTRFKLLIIAGLIFLSPAVHAAETFTMTGNLINCLFASDWTVNLPEGLDADIKHCGFAGTLNIAESGTHYNSWANIVVLDDGADETIVLTNWALFDSQVESEARETGDGTTTYTNCEFSISEENFIDYTNENFRLKQGVLLVNAGAAAAAVTDDIDGRTRPAGGLPDIGPYEGQPGLLFSPWLSMPLKFQRTWRP